MVDFNSFRALQPLYDAAKEAGIWIVLRPGILHSNFPLLFILTDNIVKGPYINAETTAGGIAHWATSQVAGTMRTNATDFRQSWQDYMAGIINTTEPNQITKGGPVIGTPCCDISVPLK